MIDQQKFFNYLKDNGVEFITGVPDSHLNEFCLFVQKNMDSDRHVVAANEGNAIALAAGYHLATGTTPLVYMQNSGIGNSINPLLSLTDKNVYAIPLVLLIGWRGEPEIKDHCQHKKQGELTTVLMKDMDIPYKIIDDDNDEYAINAAKWAVETARQISGPVALIAKKGMFEKGKEIKDKKYEDNLPLSREDAIESLLHCLPRDSVFLATTGRATRELYDLRTKQKMEHGNDFLNVGAMGHTSSIATGIALAKKNRLVVCLDGDGAAIMHLGALTTTGKLQLKNFLHVILNNGVHESVGEQPTAGFTINFTKIAENCGYKTVDKAIYNKDELVAKVRKLLEQDGPYFLDIHICKGIRSDLGPLSASLAEVKSLLMNELIKCK